MRLLAEHGADPLFVHRVTYVASAGTFGASARTQATTALMAAVGMGGPRTMRAFIDLERAQVGDLTLAAVKLAVELCVDVHEVDLEGLTAAEAARNDAVAEFQSGQGGR